MTTYIRTGATNTWPYSISQLRKDEPSRSFSRSPSDVDLAVYDVYPVVEAAKPAYDPAIQKVVEVEPALVDGEWIQQWEVVALTTAEQEAYYRATNPPEWIAFQDALPAEIDQLLAAIQPVSLKLTLALGVGLGKASDGDPRVFVNAWQQAITAGFVSAELIAGIQALAVQFHLPAEFVAALGGA